MDHFTVQRWLRTVLGTYADRDRVFSDVDRTLVSVSSLSPKTEVFTFNDGRTQLLLTLDGTIPVDFRGNTYNIPVAFWIPRDYPNQPPMAFVAPTPDMAIRKGSNLDPSGEIGGDYLKRWRSKPEACNLLDLVHDCQHMFGREPPVYAKPKPTPVYATAQTTSHPATPRQQIQQASSSSAVTQRCGPPPLPASPSKSAGTSFNIHDPRGQPPSPAPAPTPGPSTLQESQHAPLRPPKPSSSLGPGSPRKSISHTDAYHSSAPIPPQGLQSPRQTAAPGLGDQEAYRRSSGYGPTSFQPAHPATPRRQGQYTPSPVSGPHSPNPGLQWQPHPQDHSNHRQGSQQYSQQHHPPPPDQKQQQQRSYTYPYPTSESHADSYSTTSAPHQLQPYPQPQNGSNSAPPPSPGPQPQQVLHHSNLSHASSSVADSNGYHHNSPTPPPVAAPKPKGINLLDEDELTPCQFAVPTGPASNSAAPPPPRPINPELLSLHEKVYTKLTDRLSTLEHTLSTSNSQLSILNSDLDRGLPAITDEMNRLKAVRDVCQTTGDRLQSSVSALTESVRTLQEREDPDPDSMVLATSIVGNQLVDLVAEDNAIEDTLYQLGRALNAERIDLERFLKQTRMLAREQFMTRALAMKISEGMGWS
ncbi:related to Tumor susceptibility gene 101 protein [Melanopsichium pennsylvanicum]|uniref:Related to Tumor susceptibility gene 101 protein n=2 Tax=Melanopsichium pennsylvanicum TaxID=63383 RepID=A0AAJ5C4U8_9BASI|nr:related to Tumor susceptibility gene 101 protein [Melanopsichium pennsylvanicum 4]SNX83878.1 related to Tumor susceptibility gene 101 protein [Melanopsichium pennsylvanicum]